MRSLKGKAVVIMLVASAGAGWGVDWIPDGQPPAGEPSKAPAAEKPKATIEWEKSFDAALGRAKKEKKPVMVEFYTTWQQWCRVLDEKTLSDSDIVGLSRKFACVRLNAKDVPDLVEKYRVTGYPTVLFLNPRGEAIHRVIGYVPARPFEQEMKDIAKGREPAKELEKLEKSNPKDFRPLVMLGVGYLKYNEWDKAIDAYERALAVSPGMESKETHEVIYSLSQLYDHRGKPEKAEPLLRDLLRAESSDKANVHYRLGHVYLSLKRTDDAVEEFTAARDLTKDDEQRQEIDRMIEHIRSLAKR